MRSFFIFVCLISTMAFATERQKIIVLGDSLSEGYGVAKPQTYPALLQNYIDKDGLKYEVLNSSISGSTTASGPSRIRWQLKQKPSILLLALGANDGLRGLDLRQSEANLKETIELAQKEGVRVILAGMQLPPNYGEKYRNDFQEIFVRLAKQKNCELIPFLLEGVGGVKNLNQADGIHPNAKGHEKIAMTVWQTLKSILK